jgi:hypothetical protein
MYKGWTVAKIEYQNTKGIIERSAKNFGEFLVELRPVKHKELSEVVIVKARTNIEAIYLAFSTRNIAYDWVCTDVQRDSVEL